MNKLLIISGGIALFSGIAAAKSQSTIRQNFPAEGIKCISSTLRYEDVEFSRCDGDEIQIEIITTAPKSRPEARTEGGTFFLRSQDKRMSFRNERCTVYVRIPETCSLESLAAVSSSGNISCSALATSGQFSVQASSGNISCRGITCGGSFSATASSGDISLEDIRAAAATLRTSSGNISCRSLAGSGAFSATASSGDIRLHAISAADIQLQSNSGSIKAETLTSEGAVSACSSSGDISIEALDVSHGSIDMKSSSGSIMLSLAALPGKASRLAANSGNIRLVVPKGAGFQIEAASKSGGYRDTLEGISIGDIKSFAHSYNGGGTSIHISTSSGKISVADTE